MPNPPPPRRRSTTAATPAAQRPPRVAPVRPPPSRAGAPAGPHLSCTAGPKAGTSFPLDAEEFVIGRAAEATISIPDTSVSRRHAELKKTETGWTVADLGSGNGTQVNGEAVTEERLLSPGDTLTVGDTEFTFVDDTPQRELPTRRPVRGAGREPNAPLEESPQTNPAGFVPPRPVRSNTGARVRPGRNAPPPVDPAAKRKRMTILAAVALGVLLVIAVAVKVRSLQSAREAEQNALTQAQQAAKDQVNLVFQEGKNLAAKGRWAEAKVKFEAALEAAQPFPALAQTIQTYLDRAGKEIPNQAALAEAEKALSEDRLGDAAADLQKVSADTSILDKPRDLKMALQQKITARLQDARAALAAGGAELEKARDIAEDALKADSDNRDAKSLSDQAKEAIDRRDHPRVADSGPKAKPWEPAIARYRDGDLTGALALLDECASKKAQFGKDAAACRGMANDMREVSQLVKRVAALEAKDLDRLLRMDRNITHGGISKVAQQAGTIAASKFCLQASNAKQAGKWAVAAEYAGKALAAAPDSSCAKSLVSDLRGRCKDTYMRAYSMKDSAPDEALPIFKEAVAVCAPEDDYHAKAQHQIDAIERH